MLGLAILFFLNGQWPGFVFVHGHFVDFLNSLQCEAHKVSKIDSAI